ncbi:DUF7344 domain-containing protein [Halovivax cerinus]|uniref:ArsR family transcriptional regulator n=1 Tax=Halovivax cerinus TaxID=1487865 RepID=A0ABD5NKX7_9EURY|nr:ArsR family transcriptional regulator [Halovivax cerinus]
MGTPIEPSTACALLSDPIRRSLLELFRDQPVWSIQELAVELAPYEGASPSDPDRSVDGVQIDLVHNHVPRLVDHGILEWDTRSGDVVRSDNYEAIVRITDLTADDHETAPAAIPDRP